MTWVDWLSIVLPMAAFFWFTAFLLRDIEMRLYVMQAQIIEIAAKLPPKTHDASTSDAIDLGNGSSLHD